MNASGGMLAGSRSQLVGAAVAFGLGVIDALGFGVGVVLGLGSGGNPLCCARAVSVKKLKEASAAKSSPQLIPKLSPQSIH